MLTMAKRRATNTLIHCSCGRILGELVAGCVAIRHQGREVLADHVVAIRCERCGAVWKQQDVVDNQGSK